MPEERRLQAQAELGERYRTQSSPGVSPWLVAGIVVLALSLVAIGTMVVLRSLQGGTPGTARLPDPTPTPARPTPGVFTVGKQGEGATPTTSNEGSPAPGINPPAGSNSGPLFNPAAPVVKPSAPAPAAGGDPAAPASPASTEPSPG